MAETSVGDPGGDRPFPVPKALPGPVTGHDRGHTFRGAT